MRENIYCDAVHVTGIMRHPLYPNPIEVKDSVHLPRAIILNSEEDDFRIKFVKERNHYTIQVIVDGIAYGHEVKNAIAGVRFEELKLSYSFVGYRIAEQKIKACNLQRFRL
jgi:hypothetical protein